uniref:Uncharacterized protein n=1 Tax=Tanacetum cinerariifolium TaxID=118510 RepID=A0A6L2N7R6_TANCI|nr:hypothetical protein [Tanacetum cinerariifolium]
MDKANKIRESHEHRHSLLPDLEHRNRLGRPDLQQHQTTNTYSLICEEVDKKHINEVAAPEGFQFLTLIGVFQRWWSDQSEATQTTV